MERSPFDRKNLLVYIAASYGVFWLIIGLIGIAIFVLKLPPPVISTLKTLSAWSPTLALLLLFKRVMPQWSLRAFLKRELLTPVTLRMVLQVLALMVGILLFSAMLAAVFGEADEPFFNPIAFSALPALILTTLTSGATGEELGWRGYAYHELRKRYEFAPAALILGLVWGFWHLPLWFMNAFTGVVFAQFIFVFMAGIISHSVIIAFFYERSGSLWVAVLIHFLYNFLAQMTVMEPQNFMFFWPPYVLTALILVAVEKRTRKRGRIPF